MKGKEIVILIDSSNHLAILKRGTSPPPFTYYKIDLEDSLINDIKGYDSIKFEGKNELVENIPFRSPHEILKE